MTEKELQSQAETFLMNKNNAVDGSGRTALRTTEATLIKVSKDLLAADAGGHLILMLADCSSA